MHGDWRFRGLLLAMLGVAALTASCGGGGNNEKDRMEVEEIALMLLASGGDEIDFFLAHVTDNALENFGYTRDECREDAAECVGEPSEASLANTKVSGKKATTDVAIQDFTEFRFTMLKEGDVWKLDKLTTVPKEIPGGVKKVDLELNEFSFALEGTDIEDGNFAFVVKNVGEQNHQVVVVKIPEDFDLETAVQSDEQPQDVEDVAFVGPFGPGDDGTVVFDEPLESGRYAVLCFLPDTDDTEKTEHARKGMYRDFDVP